MFVAVEAGLIYAMVKFRRRSDDDSPVQTHGNTTLEVTWTAIPAALLIVVAIPTVFTIFDNANSPDPVDQGGLVVDAIGHQWWFEFEYADAGGGKTITTANELRVPVDTPVRVLLESDDVIHSLWIPRLAGTTSAETRVLQVRSIRT